MKTKLLLVIIITLFSINCKESGEYYITFSEPQPVNKRNLNEFPNKLLGMYKNYDTDEELIINKNNILKYKIIHDTIHKTLKDSILLDQNLDKYIKIVSFVEHSKDSFVIKYKKIDTIFTLKNNIIKKYKGHYFLNTQIDSLEWKVEKLTLNKNVLNLNNISTKNEILIMKEILDQETNDSLYPIKVMPNKKQFKEFIQKSGFTNGKSYIKKP